MRTSSRSTVRSSDISGAPLPRPSAKMGVNQQGRPRNWGPAERRLAGHSRCQALGGSLPWEQSWPLGSPSVAWGGARSSHRQLSTGLGLGGGLSCGFSVGLCHQ